MSKEPQFEVAVHRGSAGAVAALLGAAVAVLPIFDALGSHAVASAFSGALGGASAPAPVGAFLYAGLGVVVAIAFARAWRRVDGPASVILAAAVVFTLGYAVYTAHGAALSRSRQVDDFNYCEWPGSSPRSRDVWVSDIKSKPRFDGPHLPNGDPCVKSDEHRDIHVQQHPEGSFADGMAQMWIRFSGDRIRHIVGPVGVLVALLIVLGWMVRSRRQERRLRAALADGNGESPDASPPRA